MNMDRASVKSRTIDLEAARSSLDSHRARLLGEVTDLGVDERALGEARDLEGGPGTDSADIASDVAEEEVSAALRQNVGAQLFEVDRALARIADGTYGDCERCQGPIDPARLRVLPWARYCLSCQKRSERTASL